jgi:pimeloyl-ACP methyl ester carboxylesterase
VVSRVATSYSASPPDRVHASVAGAPDVAGDPAHRPFRALVAGATVRYAPGSDTAGPLAVCVHGFPDWPYTYRYLLPVLTATTCTAA